MSTIEIGCIELPLKQWRFDYMRKALLKICNPGFVALNYRNARLEILIDPVTPFTDIIPLVLGSFECYTAI